MTDPIDDLVADLSRDTLADLAQELSRDWVAEVTALLDTMNTHAREAPGPITPHIPHSRT